MELIMVGFLSVFLLMAVFGIGFMGLYVKELVTREKDRPVIVGPIINQLIYFKTLYDYLTDHGRKNHSFRFITPTESEIYIIDPANVEYILKTNFSNYTKGRYNYSIMKDLFGDGIFAVDGEKWRHQRKLASHEFSTKVLRDFSSAVFQSNAAKFVGTICQATVMGGSVDLQEFLMKSTLDSIFKVGFGIELNSLSGSDEFGNRFTKAFDDSNAIVFWRYVDPFWEIKRFFNIGLEARLKRNIKIIDDFVFQTIRFKRVQMKSEKGEKVKEDMLSRFIIESEKEPEKMTDRYLRDIILNFVIAGKDTSANTLTWFFYMLCKHPLIQEKISQEIREATNVEGMISAIEFSERLTQEALDKMQYLHAALTETLRLYPAVPVDGKSCGNDDVLPDGLKVKKGDTVIYAPYVMGRMSYIWGEDAEEFRPERWIQNGSFQAESYFKFTSFQAGPRICLGKEFAYSQMKILSSILLYFFKFKLVDPKREAAYRTMFTLHMDQGLHVFAIQRMSFS
ncbi:hypothetical protein ACHQM5_001028 [Ranunculus cassubicifolius]